MRSLYEIAAVAQQILNVKYSRDHPMFGSGFGPKETFTYQTLSRRKLLVCRIDR